MRYLDAIKVKTHQNGTDGAVTGVGKATTDSTVSTSQGVSHGKNGATADCGLAAKLRALGCPIALEVEGKPVCWLVADKEAEARAEVSPCFTADEVEVLVQFDAQGMRDLIDIKRALGGTLGPDSKPINRRA